MATEVEAPIEAVALDTGPVIVPLRPIHSDRPLDRYYADVIGQMQEALTEVDAERLRALITQHDRPNAPDWARERLTQFRAASRGLDFAVWAAEHSVIRLEPQAPPIGAPMAFVVEIALPPALAIDVGVSFLVSLALVDFDPFGGRSERSSSMVLGPGDGTVRAEAWELPFAMEFEAGDSVIRQLRIGVDLLPGMTEIEDETAPLPRLTMAQREDLLFPAGVEPIREKPLLTLRNALALGDEAHLPHQYLASYFMPQADRAQAMGLLMPNVRLGDPRQARVAMASLQLLSGEDIAVEDREGWLAWWQERRQGSQGRQGQK